MNPTDAPQPHPVTANSGRETYTYPRLQVPLFGSDYLEYAKRQLFARHPDYLPTLIRLLDVHPNMTIVEVNCGTGFYTRLIASRLQGEGHVVGIDSDLFLLTSARQATIVEGWDELITYYLGVATALPAPDAAADLVFANGSLWVLPEEQRIPAIHEMWRVLQIGGRVLLAEPDGGLVHAYDPQRPRLQELEQLLHVAFVRGTAIMDGHDYQLGRTLPTLFAAAGFERIRVYPRLFVVAGNDLGADPKQGLLDRVKEYQQALAGLMSTAPEAKLRREQHAARLYAGGLSESDYSEHYALTIARLQELTEHPEKILQDTSVFTYGGLFCEGYRV